MILVYYIHINTLWCHQKLKSNTEENTRPRISLKQNYMWETLHTLPEVVIINSTVLSLRNV